MAEHDQFASITPLKFVVDLHIDGKMERSFVTALDKESLMAHLSIVVALNLARIPGYAVYDEHMNVLASVNATEFMAGIKALQKAPPGGTPAPPGQTWSAVPVVTPSSEDFQKAMDNRRRPQDASADAKLPSAPLPAVTPQPHIGVTSPPSAVPPPSAPGIGVTSPPPVAPPPPPPVAPAPTPPGEKP